MCNRRIALENERQTLHSGKFLRYSLPPSHCGWAQISTVFIFNYSYAYWNTCTYTCMCICIYIGSFKKNEILIYASRQGWWWESSSMMNVCLCYMTVAQLFTGLSQRNYCLRTLSCSLNSVPGELPELLTLCACGMGSQSREEAMMLFWKISSIP